VFDASNPPSNCTPASLAQILTEDVPIRDVLAFPPQPITAPLAIEAAHSSFTAIDFVPKSFARGPVQEGAALYSLEGDFGFSAANATAPAPEVSRMRRNCEGRGEDLPLLPLPVPRLTGYCALATPWLSKSTLRFNATVRPSTPSRRSTELNSERCTASWLIVPSR
jgi:hypothetical protein